MTMGRFSPIDYGLWPRIPADHIICTECHRDAGEFPDLSDLSADDAAKLIDHWMCSDCLDDFERSEGYFLG